MPISLDLCETDASCTTVSPSQEIVDVIKNSPNPRLGAEKVVKCADSLGTSDNSTCVVARGFLLPWGSSTPDFTSMLRRLRIEQQEGSGAAPIGGGNEFVAGASPALNSPGVPGSGAAWEIEAQNFARATLAGGSLVAEEIWRLVDRDHDGKVTQAELASGLRALGVEPRTATWDEKKGAVILDLVENLWKDLGLDAEHGVTKEQLIRGISQMATKLLER
jgi:hypothetical protein